MEKQVWFEMQYRYRRAGADDWFNPGADNVADTIESARVKLDALVENNRHNGQFDFRIVRKTLTEEVAS